MKKTFLLPSLVVLIPVAACGSGKATPKTTLPKPSYVVTKTKLYSDAAKRFSFRYPANWTIPHPPSLLQGKYIVTLEVPGSMGNVEVTVSPFVKIPTFKQGVTSPRQGGGKFQYFHATMGGVPAMRIHRLAGKEIIEVDTVADNRDELFDVRMVIVPATIPPQLQADYNTVVSTLKIPFS